VNKKGTFLDTTPWRYLLCCLMVIFALILLDWLHSTRPSTLTTQVPDYVSQGRIFTAPARVVGQGKVVFHLERSPTETGILEEQLGPGHTLIGYHLTWPEYFGLALVGVFAVCCFWFSYSLICREWNGERTRQVSTDKLAGLAAFYPAYGLAAWLGWVWMNSWPFFAMGAVLILFRHLCLEPEGS